MGVKPTYGRVSRYGLTAFASSLDQIGPFTKNVTDAALLTGVLSGHDPMDSTSMQEPVPDYRAAFSGSLKGLRIGLPKEYMIGGMHPEVEALVLAAVRQLVSLVAEIVGVPLPSTEYSAASYHIISPVAAYTTFSRFSSPRDVPWV